MLEVSFKSLSRISLAGFLNSFENEKMKEWLTLYEGSLSSCN